MTATARAAPPAAARALTTVGPARDEDEEDDDEEEDVEVEEDEENEEDEEDEEDEEAMAPKKRLSERERQPVPASSDTPNDSKHSEQGQ